MTEHELIIFAAFFIIGWLIGTAVGKVLLALLEWREERKRWR